jgi:hypothetical protein
MYVSWGRAKQIMANKALHSIISENINSTYLKVKEKLVDIKGVNGRRTQYNGNKEKVQNDKQRDLSLIFCSSAFFSSFILFSFVVIFFFFHCVVCSSKTCGF